MGFLEKGVKGVKEIRWSVVVYKYSKGHGDALSKTRYGDCKM